MKYLGVDWGLKKVGLAVSEGIIASPLKTLAINGLEDGINKILEVVKKEEIDQIVIGVAGGESGKMSQKALAKLRQRGLKAVAVDETLTTKDAQATLIEMGLKRSQRKDDNSMAAALILQGYLDELKAKVKSWYIR